MTQLHQYLIPKTINLKEKIPLGIILDFSKEIIVSPDLFDNLDDYDQNKYQRFSVKIIFSIFLIF